MVSGMENHFVIGYFRILVCSRQHTVDDTIGHCCPVLHNMGIEQIVSEVKQAAQCHNKQDACRIAQSTNPK